MLSTAFSARTHLMRFAFKHSTRNGELPGFDKQKKLICVICWQFDVNEVLQSSRLKIGGLGGYGENFDSNRTTKRSKLSSTWPAKLETFN
jgi:hypothetical protein